MRRLFPWLAAPLALIGLVFALEAAALAIGGHGGAAWCDYALLAAVALGAGLPALGLGVGSADVVRPRWPILGWVGGGLVALPTLVLVGWDAIGAITGTADADPIGLADGASLVFALWALKAAIPVAVIAFLWGRASAGQGGRGLSSRARRRSGEAPSGG